MTKTTTPPAEPADIAPVDPTIAAATEAAEPAAAPTSRTGRRNEPRVSYRVLKKGDGQVFTGQTDPETGLPETYAKGDQVDDVPISIAQALEDRDFVEIVS